MRALSDYDWRRISGGLVVIFGAGGLWEIVGLAKLYPAVTPWVLVVLAVLALFFNTGKEAK